MLDSLPSDEEHAPTHPFEAPAGQLMQMLAMMRAQTKRSRIETLLKEYETLLATMRKQFPKQDFLWEEFGVQGRDMEEFCRQYGFLTDDMCKTFERCKSKQPFIPDTWAHVYVQYSAIEGQWPNVQTRFMARSLMDDFTRKMPEERRGDVLVQSIAAVATHKQSDDEWYGRFYWASIDTAHYFYRLHARLSPQNTLVEKCRPAIHCLGVLKLMRQSIKTLDLETAESATQAKNLMTQAGRMRRVSAEKNAAQNWPNVFRRVDSWTRQLKNVRLRADAILRRGTTDQQTRQSSEAMQ